MQDREASIRRHLKDRAFAVLYPAAGTATARRPVKRAVGALSQAGFGKKSIRARDVLLQRVTGKNFLRFCTNFEPETASNGGLIGDDPFAREGPGFSENDRFLRGNIRISENDRFLRGNIRISGE